MFFEFIFFIKRNENLWEFLLILFKYNDLNIRCCISIIINPNPNSTADNIRKKKVKDSKFTLSKIKPTTKTIMYSDIHNNSAVNNKCRAVFMFSIIVKKKNKKHYKY
jgi:hypothetical protein